MAGHSAMWDEPIDMDTESIKDESMASSNDSINNDSVCIIVTNDCTDVQQLPIELADADVKEDSDIQANKDPLDVNIEGDVAYVEVEWSPDDAAVEQDLHIGFTGSDMQCTPEPCEPEPSTLLRSQRSGGRGRRLMSATESAARGKAGVARASRGRKRASRGRGGRQGASVRPSALDDVYLGFVEDLPMVAPLETPIHPKKRKMLLLSQSVSAEPSAAEQASQIGPATPAPPVSLPIEASTSGLSSPQPPSNLTFRAKPPSPAAYTECGESDASSDAGSPRPDYDELAKGSEEESCDEDGAETEDRVVIKRGHRIFHLPSRDPVGDEGGGEGASDSDGELADPGLLLCPDWPPPRSPRRVLAQRLASAQPPSSQPRQGECSSEVPPLPQSLLPPQLRQSTVPPSSPQTLQSLSPRSPSPPQLRQSPLPGSPSSPQPLESLFPRSPSPPQPLQSPLPRLPLPPGQVYGPTDMFEFTWEKFPDPQIPAALRRETFSESNYGANAPYEHPYDAFTAIWDRSIMENIAEMTNKYAQQYAARLLREGGLTPWSRITNWKDTNADELYVFFAIILSMGVLVKSHLSEYWSSIDDIFQTKGFAASMSYDRFHLLSRCLHFVDSATVGLAELTTPQAKLCKVQPIVDHLNDKFSHLFNLGQNIALDESLTEWKGLLSIKQFIKTKAASEGIKTHEVCDSKTGYLWRFEVHAGAQPSREGNPISGAIPTLVLRLLHGLAGLGHTVWMDSYYHSPALARQLKVLGFDCAGTLRTNRQFVPVELTNLMASDMAKGQVFGCTSGDVDLLVWRDERRVALISTYHGLTGSAGKRTFTPTLIQDYNLRMGGVDKKDQILAMYPTERKRTRVWYKKFFRRLLNVSVLNSFLLLTHNPHNQRKSSVKEHRSFRKILIRQLLECHSIRQINPRTVSITGGPRVILPRDSLDHFPEPMEPTMRRKCRVCGKRVRSWCPSCKAALCLVICHKSYHSLNITLP